MRSSTRARPVRILAGVLAGSTLVATLAWASHRFADVPTSASYHAAVDWIADRGVTLGCATNLYCPDGLVTRAQMALFMQRLGNALTPRVLSGDSAVVTGAFSTLPTVAVHCQTADHTPDFPQRAIVHSAFHFATPSGFSFAVEPVVSTNGGATWTALPGQPGRGGKPQEVQAFYVNATDVGARLLSAGVTYRFGTRVQILQGSNIIGDGGCEVVATIVNANVAFVPLSADAAGGP